MSSTPIRDFIEKHYLHFNSAALVDAAKGYELHMAEGGKMMVTLAGAMSTAELGLSLGMKFDPALLEATPGGVSLLARSSMIGDDDEEADSLDFTKLVDSHLPDADDEDE